MAKRAMAQSRRPWSSCRSSSASYLKGVCPSAACIAHVPSGAYEVSNFCRSEVCRETAHRRPSKVPDGKGNSSSCYSRNDGLPNRPSLLSFGPASFNANFSASWDSPTLSNDRISSCHSAVSPCLDGDGEEDDCLFAESSVANVSAEEKNCGEATLTKGACSAGLSNLR